MVVAVFVGFDHIDQEPGQVIGIGGSADLVVDDAYGVMVFASVEHRLDKVLAVDAEDPRNSDDEVFVEKGADCQLSFQFALSVDVERRIVLVVRLPGAFALTVKDVVCADVDHFGVDGFGGLRDVARALRVDGVDFGAVLLVLSGIHGGPCRTVNDRIGMNGLDGLHHSFAISNVQPHIIFLFNLLDIGADDFMFSYPQLVDAIMSQLSINACHKSSHAHSL